LIIHAVSHLWKVAEMRRYYNLQQLEFWLALATLLGVITIDVLPGLVIGVAAMLLLVIEAVAQTMAVASRTLGGGCVVRSGSATFPGVAGWGRF
jgi:MFS superfamily sulfate permease-like transporter